jgi:hypothetical protein
MPLLSASVVCQSHRSNYLFSIYLAGRIEPAPAELLHSCVSAKRQAATTFRLLPALRRVGVFELRCRNADMPEKTPRRSMRVKEIMASQHGPRNRVILITGLLDLDFV